MAHKLLILLPAQKINSCCANSSNNTVEWNSIYPFIFRNWANRFFSNPHLSHR